MLLFAHFYDLRFGSAKGFSALYYRVDPGKLLYNALTIPVNLATVP